MAQHPPGQGIQQIVFQNQDQEVIANVRASMEGGSNRIQGRLDKNFIPTELEKVCKNPLQIPDEDEKFEQQRGSRRYLHILPDVNTEKDRSRKTSRYLPPISKHAPQDKVLEINLPPKPKVQTVSPKKQIQKIEQQTRQETISKQQKVNKTVIEKLPSDPNFIYQAVLEPFILHGTVNRVRINGSEANNRYHFEVSNSQQNILQAQGRRFVINSIYDIFCKSQTIATLQSNYSGSRFQLRRIGSSNILCVIQYTGGSWRNTTRTMKVTLNPNQERQQAVVMQMKQPARTLDGKRYTLDFHNRAKEGSVKNFILVDNQQKSQETLLLGKMTRDQFSLDVSFPVSPLEAFGIALSSFDPKLVCE